MRRKTGLLLLTVALLQALAGCGKPGGSGSRESESAAAQGEGGDLGTTYEYSVLRDAVPAKMGGFIGTAVTGAEADDQKLWEIITTEFSAVTLGNELKPDCLFGYSNGRCPGTESAEVDGVTIAVPKLNYSRAEKILDKILRWNEENPDRALKVRGHVLVWHSQTPEWFFHEDYDKQKPYADRETMNRRLEWYIRTVLTHFTGEESRYKGLFYGWDVVNEAVSDASGTYRSDSEKPDEPLSNDTHGSNSSWYHVYQSNEYIVNAFRYANKYAPAEVELYYNDYNECAFIKSRGIAELLRAVKEQEGAPGEGTRIDGMGMQGHYNMTGPSMLEFGDAALLYAEIAGSVQVTEMDLKASGSYDGTPESREKEYESQTNRYRSIYNELCWLNRENIVVKGITFWGVADHYSWLQNRSDVGGGADGKMRQCPLLFDEKYEKKPCYYVFLEQ